MQWKKKLLGSLNNYNNDMDYKQNIWLFYNILYLFHWGFSSTNDKTMQKKKKKHELMDLDLHLDSSHEW